MTRWCYRDTAEVYDIHTHIYVYLDRPLRGAVAQFYIRTQYQPQYINTEKYRYIYNYLYIYNFIYYVYILADDDIFYLI